MKYSRDDPQVVSNLLENIENVKFVEMMQQSNNLSLAAAIVQVWQTERPLNKDFTILNSGLLTVVKDFTRHSYFFRLYGKNLTLLWEQEIYYPIRYVKLLPRFHYFIGDETFVGFNFHDIYESEDFWQRFRKILKRRWNFIKLVPISLGKADNQVKQMGYMKEIKISKTNTAIVDIDIKTMVQSAAEASKQIQVIKDDHKKSTSKKDIDRPFAILSSVKKSKAPKLPLNNPEDEFKYRSNSPPPVTNPSPEVRKKSTPIVSPVFTPIIDSILSSVESITENDETENPVSLPANLPIIVRKPPPIPTKEINVSAASSQQSISISSIDESLSDQPSEEETNPILIEPAGLLDHIKNHKKELALQKSKDKKTDSKKDRKKNKEKNEKKIKVRTPPPIPKKKSLPSKPNVPPPQPPMSTISNIISIPPPPPISIAEIQITPSRAGLLDEIKKHKGINALRKSDNCNKEKEEITNSLVPPPPPPISVEAILGSENSKENTKKPPASGGSIMDQIASGAAKARLKKVNKKESMNNNDKLKETPEKTSNTSIQNQLKEALESRRQFFKNSSSGSEASSNLNDEF